MTARHVAVGLLLAGGCATPLHTYSVERLRADRDSCTSTRGRAAVAASPCSNSEPQADVGAWFARRVYDPTSNGSALSAIEIIYCPTDRAVFDHCRMAIAWSRDGRGGLGPQVVDAAKAIEGPAAAPAVPSAKSATPAPQPLSWEGVATPESEPQQSSIAINGRAPGQLDPWEGRQLRLLEYGQVTVTLRTGSKVSGRFIGYDDHRINLEAADGASKGYEWTEVLSVSASHSATPAKAEPR